MYTYLRSISPYGGMDRCKAMLTGYRTVKSRLSDLTVTSRTSLGRFLSLCVRFGLKKGSKTTSLQQLLQLTYAPPRRRICFVTSLTMSKSVYRHFGSMASSSARARAAGIWAEDGAHGKGVILACFLLEMLPECLERRRVSSVCFLHVQFR